MHSEATWPKLGTKLTLILCACALVPTLQAQESQRTRALQSGYETAQSFERKNDWVSAEREWRRVLELAPSDARAWTNLGVVLNRQLRYEDAIAAWNRAITINPNLAGPYLNIGLAGVKKAEYSTAIAPLRRTLSLEAENDAARRALVVALVGTENFKDATRELALLLAKSPNDSALLEISATVFLRQNRYVEAATVLKRRLALTVVTATLWAQYGDALDGASRTPEAAEAYRKAVALDPNSTLFRYALGYLYWKLYRYEEAEHELVEVLKREKENARAAFTLGDLYLTKGNAAKALPFLTQAAAAYPGEFDTRFALGRALIITGDSQRGIAELRAAISIDDTIADGHFQLGRALQKAGLKEEAKRELDRARVLHDQKRKSEVRKPQ